jgi:signal transduction histidine kinase
VNARLFLAVTLLLGALEATLLALVGGCGWEEGLILGAPLGVVQAAIVFAARYPCLSAPLGPGRGDRVLGTQVAAAVLSTGLWGLFGGLFARALDTVPRYAGTALRFQGAAPTLMVVGMLVYLLAAAVHYLLIALESARAAEVRGVEARVLAREAELRALRAQVDPHFLFNSLNSIASLTGDDPQAARHMCLLLAAFLRRSLVLGSRERVTLEEELQLLDEYLAIEKVRFGRRLAVEHDIARSALPALIPPLLLQPLVENAVRHGIAQRLEGGTLAIEARLDGGTLRLRIENPRDAESPGRRGAGLGLDNVRGRLRSLFGDAARLEVTPGGESFRVDLSLPFEPAPASQAAAGVAEAGALTGRRDAS